MTDWNPDDPDAVRVHYDLSAWTFDQQAELAAAMADAEIPHTWAGSELLIPFEYEGIAEPVINDVEQRTGVVYPEVDDSDESDAAAAGPLDAAESITEYDRSDAPEGESDVVARALTRAGIAHRWEGTTLVVATADEALVDALLDDIESGDYVDLDDDDDDDLGDAPSADVLTSFFLAGERLRRNPRDAAGLKHLSEATAVSNPRRPPFGVQPALWQRTCIIADRLTDALVDEEGLDHDAAVDEAEALHDLLRPYI
ncbi:MAG: hypothetical protein WCO88_04155 [Actinomycetota bacterium]